MKICGQAEEAVVVGGGDGGGGGVVIGVLCMVRTSSVVCLAIGRM